jgi:hypothetical protein
VHADQKLYLVFEFLDVDLKRYMEAGNSQGTPISLELCQVCTVFTFILFSHLAPLNATCKYAMPIVPLIGLSAGAPARR